MRSRSLLRALLVSLVVSLAGAPAASAAQKVITSSGPLTSIYLNDDLACSVDRNGETQVFFGTDPGACGTFLATGGTVYGPAGVPPTTSGAAFTPVSQTELGTGVAFDPFQVVTVADATAAGLKLTRTDSYFTGDDFYSTEVVVTNPIGGAADQDVKLYHAADCYVRGDDEGYGHVSGSNAYCSRQPSVAASGLLGFEPVAVPGGSFFLQGSFSEVWTAVDGTDLPGGCGGCPVLQDNGVAINWSFTVPDGGSVTREFRTRVSADSTDPETTITGGPSSPVPTPDNTPTFTFTSNEPGVAFGCQVDGGPLASCNSSHTTAPLGAGPHVFRVLATDPDGNTDPTPAARSFTVAAASTGPPPAGTPPPPAGLPAPQTRRTFSSSVKSGEVSIKCPGDRRFRDLKGDNTLSFRCLVDARKGGLEITTTAGGGKTQSALFYEGIFKAAQTRGSRPVTELSLAGKLQTGSWARGSGVAQQARRRRRRLWGRGRGRFRTRGRRGSASVRGTTWLVEDRSNNTTFFKVTSGRVAVRDFGRRKTIQLRRGKSYTAKPRRRRR